MTAAQRPVAQKRDNRTLLLPYLAPYFVYVLMATIAADRVSREVDYAIRIVLTGGLIAWAWRYYVPLRGPLALGASVAIGAAAGAVGVALWVGLLAPFVGEPGEAWSPLAWTLRLIAATALVPLFEEQVMRGYVLRFALQWDRSRSAGDDDPFGVALDGRSIADVEPGDWSWTSVLISTGIFTLGHGQAEWPAAIVYGGMMAGLWIWRRDLLSCVVAHAVTNLGLALWVGATGAWAYW